MSKRDGPLAGLRVLDLIDGAGAYGTRLMVGLGADVVLLEPPGGSRQRLQPPFVQELDAGTDKSSLYYVHYNAGKRGITLDWSGPDGQDLLLRLIDESDVVFDNGQLAAARLVDAVLNRHSPKVLVSVTPFGLDGPRSSWQGTDLVCQMMSGMVELYGFREERPARFNPEQAWAFSGLAAALGALLAWYAARRTGVSDLVDIAVERVCAFTTLQKANASLFIQYGFKPRRATRRDGVASGTVLRASDGYVLLGAPRTTTRLIQLLQHAGLEREAAEAQERLGNNGRGQLPRQMQQDLLAAVVGGRSRMEAVELAQSFGLMGMPMQDVSDLSSDPFLRDRAFFVDVEDPLSRLLLQDIGFPIRLGRTPMQPGRRPPLLGEHNAEIYRNLGLSSERLNSLREDRVL